MTDAPPGNDPWSSPSQNQPPPPPNYGSSPPGYGAPPGYGGPPARQASNGIGIAAMVVGIVALVLCWIPFLGVLLAIIALVLGILGIRKASKGEATNKGMAIAGLVTGGLALLVGGFITISTIAIFGSGEFQNILDCTQNAQTVEEQQACQEQFERDFSQ